MELGTFGAIFQFALEYERSGADFYRQAAAYEPGLARFVANAEKRVKRLERLRRESVSEMILESITGLNASDYEPDWTIAGPATLVEQGKSIEQTAMRFYRDAAERIPIIETTRAFARLAKEHGKQLKLLSEG